MADSNLTKRAFARAMKALMSEKPFEKISVGDICERCDMNRKSFYYHFRDKYDLVNWIFDTEFVPLATGINLQAGWNILLQLCQSMYDNRDFYRKALQITGQNAFSDHFQEVQYTVITHYLKILFEGQEVTPFHVSFFADAIVCAIKRWLLKTDPDIPDRFVDQLKSCIYLSADKVYHNMQTDE